MVPGRGLHAWGRQPRHGQEILWGSHASGQVMLYGQDSTANTQLWDHQLGLCWPPGGPGTCEQPTQEPASTRQRSTGALRAAPHTPRSSLLSAGAWGRDPRCCIFPACLALGCCWQRDVHRAGKTRQGRSPRDQGMGRQGCRQTPAWRGETACRECELATGHSTCTLAHSWPCTPADLHIPQAHISHSLHIP